MSSLWQHDKIDTPYPRLIFCRHINSADILLGQYRQYMRLEMPAPPYPFHRFTGTYPQEI
ncbi:hypothetical protein DPQ22_03930 [Candidatus Tokpelaia sp.]|nr:hypothetical protein DPQ22_03930 [Candidatus Tokpelaia sp.]